MQTLGPTWQQMVRAVLPVCRAARLRPDPEGGPRLRGRLQPATSRCILQAAAPAPPLPLLLLAVVVLRPGGGHGARGELSGGGQLDQRPRHQLIDDLQQLYMSRICTVILLLSVSKGTRTAC